MKPNPSQLVEQSLAAARQGDKEALGRALEACRHYLLWVANHELDSDVQARGGASDVVQDAFQNATEHFPRFQGTDLGEWQAWLRAILLNVVKNFHRDQHAAKRNVDAEVSLDDPDSRNILHEQLVLDTPSPCSRLVRGEEKQSLAEALARLPEEYRHVLRWRHEERCSWEEIGRRCDRSPDAARMLWGRAVARLQREMGADA